jgi:hypothetical protein
MRVLFVWHAGGIPTRQPRRPPTKRRSYLTAKNMPPAYFLTAAALPGFMQIKKTPAKAGVFFYHVKTMQKRFPILLHSPIPYLPSKY